MSFIELKGIKSDSLIAMIENQNIFNVTELHSLHFTDDRKEYILVHWQIGWPLG